jgi:hypothetical protein
MLKLENPVSAKKWEGEEREKFYGRLYIRKLILSTSVWGPPLKTFSLGVNLFRIPASNVDKFVSSAFTRLNEEDSSNEKGCWGGSGRSRAASRPALVRVGRAQ